MKLIFITIILFSLVACGQNTPKEELDNNKSHDSCETAIKFATALTTEQMVKSDYYGDLNNYWGDDTTKLDIKHTFESGQLLQSKFYYENGQVREEYNFKCQSLHGKVKYFHKNGKLGKVIPHRYGRKEGNGYIYDSLGVIRKKVLFNNDSLIGEPVMFDKNALEKDTVLVVLEYSGWGCPCPQWITSENKLIYESRKTENEPKKLDLFWNVKPAHDSVKIPFDLTEDMENLKFEFKGQFYVEPQFLGDEGEQGPAKTFLYYSVKHKK